MQACASRGWQRALRAVSRLTQLLALGAAVSAGTALHAQTETEGPTLVIELGSHSAPVRRIDVHVARGLALTAGDDRTARLWDLASGELRQVLRPLARGNELGRLYGAAVHPGEPLVAVAGTTGEGAGGGDARHLIHLFDVASGALVRSIDAKAGDIRKLVWSADGSVLLAGYSGSHGVRAFALDGRELLADSLPGPVFGIAVGAGGQAAAVGLDGTLRSYRVGAGAAVFGGDWRVLAWSADGKSLFVGGTAHTQALRFPVLQIDLASGRQAASIDAAADSITDLVALPIGELAYTSFDGSWGVIAQGRVARRSRRSGRRRRALDCSVRRPTGTSSCARRSSAAARWRCCTARRRRPPSAPTARCTASATSCSGCHAGTTSTANPTPSGALRRHGARARHDADLLVPPLSVARSP